MRKEKAKNIYFRNFSSTPLDENYHIQINVVDIKKKEIKEIVFASFTEDLTFSTVHPSTTKAKYKRMLLNELKKEIKKRGKK
jgi:hypothetical protein